MLTNLNNIVRYTVSGATYAITYPYWTTEEIKAYITLPDGTVSELTYGTDFTVTAPNGVNGTLTKVSAWTDAEKLTIVREVELTQEIDLINGEKIDGEQLETGLDLKTAGLQQLNEKFTRSVMTSIDETGDNMVIPNSTARKGTGDGTLLGFDGTGGNIVLRDLKQFDVDVANTAANATAAANSATLANKWAENPVDTPVEPGNYSAKHWASKASTSAGAASVSAYNADQRAEDSEAWAVGTRDGQAVDPSDPTYHNSSKYYHDIITQIISGALRYQGTWTTTGATDYSAISTPRLKGDMFYCQGTATTIGGVTYTQGDLIIFNQDVAQGTTITTSMIDKIDNTETVTPDNLATLTNKTIDKKDNTIKNSPLVISADTTINPTKEMNVFVDTADVVIHLGSAPYEGYKFTIGGSYWFYVVFKNITGGDICIGIQPSCPVTLVSLGTTNRWWLETGTTLFIKDNMLTPDGLTPNNWRAFFGRGTYHFMYLYNGANTDYDLPVSYAKVTITWANYDTAVAECIKHSELTEITPIWIKKFNTTWQTYWTRFDGVGGGTRTVKEATRNTANFNATGQKVQYIVINGWCHVSAFPITCTTAGSTNIAVATGLPKCQLPVGGKPSAGITSQAFFMNVGTTTLYINSPPTGDYYITFSYPVDATYVES